MGSRSNQLHNPHGIYVDGDQTIYIADSSNHRIVAWRKNATSGEVIMGANGQDDQKDRLNGPRNLIIDHRHNFLIISDQGNKQVVQWSRADGKLDKIIIRDIDCNGLAMDYYGNLYVANVEKSEVRRWKIGDQTGILVAGGNGVGNQLNQLNVARYIFVDEEQSVYVSDNHNHRIMKWPKYAREGIIVAGGSDHGSKETLLHYPEGFVVDQAGTLYIADSWNHRVIRWMRGASQGQTIVGGNGQGGGAHQLNSPRDVFLDAQGNLYVLDHSNQRIQKFSMNQFH